MLKFILFVQRLSYPFKFLQSSIVFFVVLVLRKIFYIKERKWSRLFGNYLSNKVRTISCQKKNMKKSITERIKTNIEYIQACPHLWLSWVSQFLLWSLFSDSDVKISSTYLNTWADIGWLSMRKRESWSNPEGFLGTETRTLLSQMSTMSRESFGVVKGWSVHLPTAQLTNTTACSVPGASSPFPLLGVFMAFWLI